MRKFLYLCGIMLLCVNVMAQIDPNDKNWDTLFIDDFSGNRYWDRHWDDSTGILGYKPLWRCFSYNLWHSGVTKYSTDYPNYHAFQPTNARFSADGTLKLVGEFRSDQPMTCVRRNPTQSNYVTAPWHKYCHHCDDIDNQHPDVHYYSGMIESTDSLGYGYYEMRCKMPIHRGSHDAFWFWGNYGHYEEIDVFEHGTFLCDEDTARGFNVGIYFNPIGPDYNFTIDDMTGDTLVYGAFNYSHLKYHSSPSGLPLDTYHTYGCLWLPECVAWYFDGALIKKEDNPQHIPQHPMWLKITHYEDRAVKTETVSGPVWWQGTDEMAIDYVKHYKLKTNCDINTVLRTFADFQNYYYSVKRSITLGGLNSTLSIPNNLSFTLRAVESITIDGAFEVPLGTNMTLITQDCPECSQEGVLSQDYCSY